VYPTLYPSFDAILTLFGMPAVAALPLEHRARDANDAFLGVVSASLKCLLPTSVAKLRSLSGL
jgi:hypothetical protein